MDRDGEMGAGERGRGPDACPASLAVEQGLGGLVRRERKRGKSVH
jgi:hypothetical protein